MQTTKLNNLVPAMTVNPDRTLGAILGTACGDALGAGYEFGPALPPEIPISMQGDSRFHPGEWTDDTSMMIPLIEAATRFHELDSVPARESIVQGWFTWARSNPPDIGVQTSRLLRVTDSREGAAGLQRGAQQYFQSNPHHSAGNGSLMRTAAVVLPALAPVQIAHTARDISELTHGDPTAGDACVIWSVAVAHAIEHQDFHGIEAGLDLIPSPRRDYWQARVEEATHATPAVFTKNGWVVQALQAAWCAIVTTPIPLDQPEDHLRLSLERAVRGGGDTDTVAAIAGGLLGARWGLSALPESWLEILHGYPGLRAASLIELVSQTGQD